MEKMFTVLFLSYVFDFDWIVRCTTTLIKHYKENFRSKIQVSYINYIRTQFYNASSVPPIGTGGEPKTIVQEGPDIPGIKTWIYLTAPSWSTTSIHFSGCLVLSFASFCFRSGSR